MTRLKKELDESKTENVNKTSRIVSLEDQVTMLKSRFSGRLPRYRPETNRETPSHGTFRGGDRGGGPDRDRDRDRDRVTVACRKRTEPRSSETLLMVDPSVDCSLQHHRVPKIFV